MLSPEASNRASEPWRTYAEALYSGAIQPDVTSELLQWHQTAQGQGVTGSRLKLGVLSGCGGDVHCGDSLETFTIHGWGYGLLQADLIEPFLMQYYALSAHAYTRGTWIAPESTGIDRNKASPSFATTAGVTAPIFLKWILVWEDPMAHTLWFGRALPRVWLTEGENVVVERASSAYGRVSMVLAAAKSTIRANLTLPEAWRSGGAPAGGLVLRLRAPRPKMMTKVTLGGAAWSTFNQTQETMTVSRQELAKARLTPSVYPRWS